MVVGEFELLKRDELTAPVRTSGRRVRVDVEPAGHRWLCLSCYGPVGQENASRSGNSQTLTFSGSQWFVCRAQPAWRPVELKAFRLQNRLSGALIRQTQNALCFAEVYLQLDLSSVDPNSKYL